MKEKRILFVEVSGNCRNLREINSLSLANLFNVRKVGSYCSSAVGWKRISKRKCKNCEKAEYVGLTREHFIYKMAKALCKTDGDDCETCGFNGNEKGCKAYLEIGNHITQAEAALNALLEAPNGK